mgnify:CR=1 FL=1
MAICIVVPQFQGRIIDAPSYNIEVLYQSPCKKFIMKLDYQDQKEVKLNINESAAANVDSKKNKGYSHSADYTGGSLKISVTRNDGSVKDKSYDAKLSKLNPSSY